MTVSLEGASNNLHSAREIFYIQDDALVHESRVGHGELLAS